MQIHPEEKERMMRTAVIAYELSIKDSFARVLQDLNLNGGYALCSDMLERTPGYLAEKAASKIALFCRGIHYILIQLPWNFRIVWWRSFCLMPCGVFILRCWSTGIHLSIVALRWHLYDQRTYKSAWICKSIFYRFRCLRTKKVARNQNGEISWKLWKF